MKNTLLTFLSEKGLITKFWLDLEEADCDYGYKSMREQYLLEAIDRHVVPNNYNPISYFLSRSDEWKSIAKEFEEYLNSSFVEVPTFEF